MRIAVTLLVALTVFIQNDERAHAKDMRAADRPKEDGDDEAAEKTKEDDEDEAAEKIEEHDDDEDRSFLHGRLAEVLWMLSDDQFLDSTTDQASLVTRLLEEANGDKADMILGKLDAENGQNDDGANGDDAQHVNMMNTFIDHLKKDKKMWGRAKAAFRKFDEEM
eukprot:gnl/TRDRNA2_/TRDRNA2_189896_c0_seq1.p1 gnl/TRDRNA2_/TRDRNA2_189896_c0~~gnl/TRDRNA2_/TRDRNA2_189896_c0_seq1.p1  ORF type:complete len:165 (+),score=53.15 gnl/TRDRNA2_/TRDRNA2_189896_c0_seq1:73-567(+)